MEVIGCEKAKPRDGDEPPYGLGGADVLEEWDQLEHLLRDGAPPWFWPTAKILIVFPECPWGGCEYQRHASVRLTILP